MTDGTGGRRRSRTVLLEGAVALAARGGISHFSLRRIAAELGTSHRMLIYHFGSRDGLIAAVVGVVEAQQRKALHTLLADGDLPPQEQAARFWTRVVEAAGTFGPLFFELTGQALQGRPHTRGLLDGLIDSWLPPLAALYERQGISPEAAPVHARLGLAAARGLLLDLLATGDRAAVQQASDLLGTMVLNAAADQSAGRRSQADAAVRPPGVQ